MMAGRGAPTMSNGKCYRRPAPWGVGGNYAAGMSTADRLSAFQLVKAMGASWIKDTTSWLLMQTPANLAKVVEAGQQAHSVGLKYFMVIVLNHPTLGATYPTAEADFVTYINDFKSWYSSFITSVAPDTVAIGAELSGPDWWLPDGVLANKTLAGACSYYLRLYNATRDLSIPGLIVGSSSGDSDVGYISGWLTEMARLRARFHRVCIYDYRYVSGTPWIWGYPEAQYGDAHGASDENIRHYQNMLNTPVIVTEAGYCHSTGTHATDVMTDGVSISRAVHADLYSRMLNLAKSVAVAGYFFHNLIDDADSPSGILDADLTPRATYDSLKALLT